MPDETRDRVEPSTPQIVVRLLTVDWADIPRGESPAEIIGVNSLREPTAFDAHFCFRILEDSLNSLAFAAVRTVLHQELQTQTHSSRGSSHRGIY